MGAVPMGLVIEQLSKEDEEFAYSLCHVGNHPCCFNKGGRGRRGGCHRRGSGRDGGARGANPWTTSCSCYRKHRQGQGERSLEQEAQVPRATKPYPKPRGRWSLSPQPPWPGLPIYGGHHDHVSQSMRHSMDEL